MFHIKNKEKIIFFSLLFTAVIIRMWGIFYATSGDLTNHITWGKAGLEHGFYLLYNFSFSKIGISNLNYPPLTVYIFTGLYSFFVFWKWLMWQLNLSISLFPSFLLPFLQNEYLLTILLKLPAIFADLGIGIVLWFLGKNIFQTKTKNIFLMLILVWFAPTFWYVSSLWAQVDSIPLFFLLLGWYFLLRNKITGATIFITCAILTKQTVIIFIPFYFLYILKKEGTIKTIKQFLLSIVLVWIAFVPFVNSAQFPLDPFKLYIQKILLAPSSEFATSYAFNFWSLVVSVRKTLDSAPFIGTLSIRNFGLAIAGLFLGIVHGGYLLAKKIKRENLFWLVQLLITMTTFMFITRLHERHLLPVVLVSIVMGLTNSKMRIVALFFSLFQFFNLVYVWDVFNFHAERFIDPLVGMKILVVIFMALFGFILVYYLQQVFFRKARST